MTAPAKTAVADTEYVFALPMGGCISELNCLQVRSPANEIAVRDAQQHLRDYGVLIGTHRALLARVEQLEGALEKYGKHANDCRSWLHVGVPGGYRCTCRFNAALSTSQTPAKASPATTNNKDTV